MIPCTRVGADVTRLCSWTCRQCFYLREPEFKKNINAPLEQVKSTILRGQQGGLTQALLTGWGEPSLYPQVMDVLDFCNQRGMTFSMITNGATGLARFQRLFEAGMDHLMVSAHAVGDLLDEIVQTPGAFGKQSELTTWMKRAGMPYCVNIAIQQLNYQHLAEIADYEAEMGAFHVSLLGIIPHYSWHNHAHEIAVHPTRLAPHIEEAADVLLARKTPFTIRYAPLCTLRPFYWKYVMMPRFVFFAPLEWVYPLQNKDVAALWRDSAACGAAVACTEPCNRCLAWRHCGGQNRVLVQVFPDSIHPITEVPAEYADVWNIEGGIFSQNPANSMDVVRRKGTIRCPTA